MEPAYRTVRYDYENVRRNHAVRTTEVVDVRKHLEELSNAKVKMGRYSEATHFYRHTAVDRRGASGEGIRLQATTLNAHRVASTNPVSAYERRRREERPTPSELAKYEKKREILQKMEEIEAEYMEAKRKLQELKRQTPEAKKANKPSQRELPKPKTEEFRLWYGESVVTVVELPNTPTIDEKPLVTEVEVPIPLLDEKSVAEEQYSRSNVCGKRKDLMEKRLRDHSSENPDSYQPDGVISQNPEELADNEASKFEATDCDKPHILGKQSELIHEETFDQPISIQTNREQTNQEAVIGKTIVPFSEHSLIPAIQHQTIRTNSSHAAGREGDMMKKMELRASIISVYIFLAQYRSGLGKAEAIGKPVRLPKLEMDEEQRSAFRTNPKDDASQYDPRRLADERWQRWHWEHVPAVAVRVKITMVKTGLQLVKLPGGRRMLKTEFIILL